MRRKFWRVSMVGILLALAMYALPAAHAQESWPCDDLIVDQANLFGSEIDRVDDAVDLLIDLGADVRVFTVESTASGDLAAFKDELRRSCPSWQTADGQEIKSSLIVVGISLGDRQTGFFYGERWLDVLDAHELRIREDLMNPRFADGDFAGGVVAGLEETARLIDAFLHPPVHTAVPTSPPATAVPTAVPDTGPEEPPDRTTLWISLIALGGLSAAGGIGGTTAYFVRRRSRRRKAQQRAREAKLKVASQLLQLQENLVYLQADVEGTAAQVPEESPWLRDQLAEVRRLIKQTATDFESLEVAGNDPDREGLSPEEYEGFATSFRELVPHLDQAGQLTEQANQRIRELEQIVAQMSATLEQTGMAIEQSRQQVAERTLELANRHAASLLERAQAKLGEARASSEDKRPLRALALTGEARGLADEAVTVVDLMPALLERVKEVEGTIDAGAELFDRIAQEYAESCWQAIRGNGTEADNRIDWAEEALHLAGEDFASEDEADWKEARERITQAEAWLDEAVGLIESIKSLKQSLEEARRAAPEEVSAAQADVQQAWQYIDKYDPDIREELETELQAAEEKLQQAGAELEREKPDYLQTVTLAQEANEAADRILAEARSEHEAIERLRRQYQSAHRSAESSVSRADHYIGVHRSDVSKEARDALSQAKSKLSETEQKRKEAEELEDIARRNALEQAVAWARKAKELGDRAYSHAEGDFRRAEARRRPPATPSWPAGAGTTPGSWGTPRHSPGRRSGGGGSRRSGGGSSGWGGSRRSGGSSSSWGSSSSSRRSGGGSSSWSSSSSRSSRRSGGGTSGW